MVLHKLCTNVQDCSQYVLLVVWVCSLILIQVVHAIFIFEIRHSLTMVMRPSGWIKQPSLSRGLRLLFCTLQAVFYRMLNPNAIRDVIQYIVRIFSIELRLNQDNIPLSRMLKR